MRRIKVNCEKCNGSGYWWNNPERKPGYKCPDCDTKGYVWKIVWK